MFKFIKQYTETMTGAAFYPIFSLLVFFLFFVALLVYVHRMDKESVKKISCIPLTEEETTDSVL